MGQQQHHQQILTLLDTLPQAQAVGLADHFLRSRGLLKASAAYQQGLKDGAATAQEPRPVSQ